MTSKRKDLAVNTGQHHQLTEEECSVAHIGRGQCRWCTRCKEWVACDKLNTECHPEEKEYM